MSGDQSTYKVIIHYQRPSTGERVSSPVMSRDEATEYWAAMSDALRDSASIQEVAS